jgi:SAM-dependent methyltransferase
MSDENCPVCGKKGEVIRELPGEFLTARLSDYYNEKFPDSIRLPDYRLRRCLICTLEYADPLVPGGRDFYDWITRKDRYYPDRWEWEKTLRLMEGDLRDGTDVLEVGCGSGEFLKRLQKFRGVKSLGVDLSPASIEICRGDGLEVHCGTVESLVDAPRFRGRHFDYVTAFHCLEHLPDPRRFMKVLSGFLKSGGSVFLSTPYSPMSFEAAWFDPLNHPPHHMTRWNSEAYRRLACETGYAVDFFFPAAAGFDRRVLRALNLKWNGRPFLKDDRTVWLQSLKRPFDFVRECLFQSKRQKIEGEVLPDEVLVRFKQER